MKIASGGTRPLRAAVLIFGMLLLTAASARAAEESAAEQPTPESYIEPTPDMQCDEFNRSWKVTNKHTYLSIKVTMKWSAVGAKELQEEFILAPGRVRALGCGSKLEIVSAELMQF